MTVITRTTDVRHTISPLCEVVGHDQEVPLVQGGNIRYANLDYAASAPALAAVADHVAAILPFYSSVHRGAGYHSQVSTEVYEAARDDVTRFVGAADDHVVVFTRNTTDAINLLAGATPGDAVVLDIEHHANLLPWRDRGQHGVRVVRAASTLAETISLLENELASAPAALLSVTGASNVTGEVLPLRALADLAHRHGARFAVDGAQLVPHRRVDLVASGVDYLAFSGHKLYAPYGAGVLVGLRDWLDAAEPHLAGGGAVREVTVSETLWAPAPARHEGGTPNVVGVAALAAACRALEALDPAAWHAHETELLGRLHAGLAALGITPQRLFGADVDGAGVDRVGLVSFTVEGFAARQVATYLSAEHGIGVRDGRFCAHPLMARLAQADGAVRVSLGLGSRSDDVDRLLRALEQLVTRGPSWTYGDAAEAFAPVADSRPLPSWLTGRTSSGAAQTSPCDAQTSVR